MRIASTRVSLPPAPTRSPAAPAPALASPKLPPRLDLTGGALRIDGAPTFLYGADLHYFRVRDPKHDEARTKAMWAETLDAMKAAGMNVVTTYVPWDYHAPGPGRFDFSGARDLRGFLELVKDRGMRAIVKPGPLILAEWPKGTGTFGAVPKWWKDAHPDSLERDGAGRRRSLDFVFGQQPAYLDPEYLAAVGDWYSAFAEQVRPFLGSTIIGVQVDNETNHYWTDPFRGAGHSASSRDFYRSFLASKYGDIDALNRAYGSAYARFDEIDPPTRSPRREEAARETPRYADAYEAGLEHAATYMSKLRGMLETRGVREPEILFMTNDAPFILSADRPALLPDGRKKRVGQLGIDLYPKIGMRGDVPHEQPFQADYFVRLFERFAAEDADDPAYLFGAELQGGLWSLLGFIRPAVPDASTDQLLARTVGRGLKGASFYVMRDGLNADGSVFDYRAAIGLHGEKTGRYEVLAAWGGFLEKYGEDLMVAEELTNRIAILADPSLDSPRPGAEVHPQLAQAVHQPGLFGWIAAAGLNPVVIDARKADADTLRGYRVVFHQGQDAITERTAKLLSDYTEGPGVLVSLGEAPTHDERGRETDAVRAFGALVAPEESSAHAPRARARSGGVLPTTGPAHALHPREGAEVILRGVDWLGRDGPALGVVERDGESVRVRLGANVHARFNSADYYRGGERPVEEAAALARELAALGAERPLLSTGRAQELAWARRSEARTYLFCVNDRKQAGVMHVRLHDGAALGIDPTRNYRLVEGLSERAMGVRSGRDLLDKGIRVPVQGFRAAVVVLEEVRS